MILTPSSFDKLAAQTVMQSFRASLLSWAPGHVRSFPWRNHLGEPYPILIAEILLKRTTAKAAAAVYEPFLNRFPTPQELANAEEGKLRTSLEPVGLQGQRSKDLAQLATQLQQNGGLVPADLGQLQKLRGLGAYSARAVLSFGHGIPAAVVDSNVARVFARVFRGEWFGRQNPTLEQPTADQMLARENHQLFNMTLLDLAATACLPAHPRHDICPFSQFCLLSQLHPGASYPRAPSAVRELRTEYGLGQSALAKKARMSKRTLVDLEGGKANPSRQTLQKLAQALDVSEERLKRPPLKSQ